MALLSIANLSAFIGDRMLFDGVNLTLTAGEHVCLLGRNGCGKSTLLRMIAGERPADMQGQIQRSRGTTIGFLTQEAQLDTTGTLREEAAAAAAEQDDLGQRLEAVTQEMAGAQGRQLERLLKQYEQLERGIHAGRAGTADHRIEAILYGLGLTEEAFDVNVADLSGGQRSRLALAKLLFAEPDLLLLDEPTNHLDIAGREWIEQFMIGYKGAAIIVTHDRYLIDRVADKIFELEDGRIGDYPGAYRAYRQLRHERRVAQQRAYEKQREQIKRERQFIERYRAGQRSRQAQGRQKRLDRLIRDESLDAPVELGAMRIHLKPMARSGDLVLTADQITKGYEDRPLFTEVSMVIKRGDRIGIVGPNGAGKSTLVRCLLGRQQLDGGSVRVGANVEPGWFAQTHEGLDQTRTVVQYLQQCVANRTEQEARDLAGAFLFSDLDQDKPLEVLSGGERGRALLAGLIAGGHNLLVLDEPTNHLDLPSVERLAEALTRFNRCDGTNQPQGTLILITHDRMLLDDLVDQLLILDGRGGLRHFLGTYRDYQMACASAPSTQDATEKKSRRASSKASPGGRQAGSRRGAVKSGGGSAVRVMSQAVLEQRIMALESQLAEIDRQLSNPRSYQGGDKVKGLQQQRRQLATELTPLEEEWARRAEEVGGDSG